MKYAIGFSVKNYSRRVPGTPFKTPLNAQNFQRQKKKLKKSELTRRTLSLQERFERRSLVTRAPSSARAQ